MVNPKLLLLIFSSLHVVFKEARLINISTQNAVCVINGRHLRVSVAPQKGLMSFTNVKKVQIFPKFGNVDSLSCMPCFVASQHQLLKHDGSLKIIMNLRANKIAFQ